MIIEPAAPLRAQDLLGAWILEDWRSVSTAGDVSYPVGEHAQGQLMYTPDGHMSGLMMSRGRTAFAQPRTEAVDFDAGTDAEVRQALNQVFGYAGTYAVDEAQAVVRHFITVCVLPGWDGRVMVRYARLSADGQTIDLAGPYRAVNGAEIRSELRWRRAAVSGS